jgi:hypothetical protein
MGFDNFCSHLPVLEKICSTFNIKNLLEFGPGNYSTKLFVSKCETVLSIEQDSQDWYEKMKSEVASPNWQIRFCKDINPLLIFDEFDKAGKKFDLVFSDGACETRCLIANLAMERNVPLVLLHDAEKINYYKWNLLDIPENYARFDYRSNHGAKKVTSILANDQIELIEKWAIPEHDRIVQVYTSPRQPMFHLKYSKLIKLVN